MCILHYCVGAAEQCQVPGRPQEADDREAFGSVSSPGAAQRSSPQSSRDLRDHLQDHRAQTPRQGPVPVQVTELTRRTHTLHTEPDLSSKRSYRSLHSDPEVNRIMGLP